MHKRNNDPKDVFDYLQTILWVKDIHAFIFWIMHQFKTNNSGPIKRTFTRFAYSPFLPCCFSVLADRWMELPCPPVCGNFRSGRFPSVLILATSSSAGVKNNHMHGSINHIFCDVEANERTRRSRSDQVGVAATDTFHAFLSISRSHWHPETSIYLTGVVIYNKEVTDRANIEGCLIMIHTGWIYYILYRFNPPLEETWIEAHYYKSTI